MKSVLLILFLLFSLNVSADQDVGVDIGMVLTQRAQLRLEPDKNSKPVRTLQHGNVVVILDREDTEGWLNVLDVETAKEGWVLKKVLKIKLTQNPSQGPNFQTEYIPSLISPEVAIENASHKDLNLKVGSKIHQISAHSNRTVTFEPRAGPI